MLNLKDLRSFRVYDFRGVHKNGAGLGSAEGETVTPRAWRSGQAPREEPPYGGKRSGQATDGHGSTRIETDRDPEIEVGIKPGWRATNTEQGSRKRLSCQYVVLWKLFRMDGEGAGRRQAPFDSAQGEPPLRGNYHSVRGRGARIRRRGLRCARRGCGRGGGWFRRRPRCLRGAGTATVRASAGRDRPCRIRAGDSRRGP